VLSQKYIYIIINTLYKLLCLLIFTLIFVYYYSYSIKWIPCVYLFIGGIKFLPLHTRVRIFRVSWTCLNMFGSPVTAEKVLVKKDIATREGVVWVNYDVAIANGTIIQVFHFNSIVLLNYNNAKTVLNTKVPKTSPTFLYKQSFISHYNHSYWNWRTNEKDNNI
jgi:hypothetical protein